MTRFRTGLAALALLSLTQSQAALAQKAAQSCVSGSEAAALFVYSVPPAVQAVQNSCDGRLQANGFLATGGPKFTQRYAALQDESWPKARRALLMLMTQAGPKDGKGKLTIRGLPGIDPLKIAQALPDDVARPLVEAMIMQKVAEKLKPERCRDIERVLGAVSPFDPRDTGALLGTVMSLVDMKDPDICVSDDQ